jgi:hypothetical protein
MDGSEPGAYSLSESKFDPDTIRALSVDRIRNDPRTGRYVLAHPLRYSTVVLIRIIEGLDEPVLAIQRVVVAPPTVPERFTR